MRDSGLVNELWCIVKMILKMTPFRHANITIFLQNSKFFLLVCFEIPQTANKVDPAGAETEVCRKN